MSSAVRDLVAAPVVGVLIQHRNKFVDWSNGTMSLDPSGAIAAMLRASPGPIDVSPSSALPSLLPHEDGRWLAAHNVHVIAPLTSGDGRMVAVVAIGAKTDGTPFDRHDRWLIVLLLTAAAGALDAGGALDPPATPGTRAAAADQEAAFECALCGVVAHSRRLPCRCGQAARLAALPVRVAEKFSVERRLGAGGMGVVYLARDAALDRHVALKTLPGLRPHAVRQLREEARAMAALNHASLATLYGLEMWRRTPVLVVEYFSGGTLAQRIASGAWSAGETVALGVRLARALVHMHARAVLHRDLKPSNIAFTAAGAPKLLDFGLATLSEPPGADHWIRPERVAGTARYAPPELFRGAPPSSAGDRWALALVMLEAIDGDNPFARVRGGVIDPSASANLRDRIDRLPHGVPALRAFLDRALAWSPDDRFQTSGDFLNALEDVADALSVRVAD